MNALFCLSSTLLNRVITSSVFFHWFNLVAVFTSVLIFSSICLLILPISVTVFVTVFVYLFCLFL